MLPHKGKTINNKSHQPILVNISEILTTPNYTMYNHHSPLCNKKHTFLRNKH